MKIGYFSLLGTNAMQERLAVEGNEINVWWTTKASDNVDNSGIKNILPEAKINVMNGPIEEVVAASDLIFCDYNSPRRTINAIRRACKIHNKPVVGANADEFNLEEDREAAKQMAEHVLGLDVTTAKRVHTKKEASEWCNSQTGLVVFKTVKSFATSCSTFIPSCKKDEQIFIEQDPFDFFRHGGALLEPYRDGTELCIGGYFNGTDFGDLAFLNQEYKYALPKKEGQVLTGEVGTVSRFVPFNELPERAVKLMRIFAEYLSFCWRSTYRGFIDLNIMRSEDKLYLLECTCRIGHPTEIECLNMCTDYTHLLRWQAGLDRHLNHTAFSKDYFVNGCLTVYGTPYNLGLNTKKKPLKIPVNGLDELDNGYQLLNGEYGPDGNVYHSLFDRVVLVHGRNPELYLAQSNYQEEASKISSWHCYIRKDIGCDWMPIKEFFR